MTIKVTQYSTYKAARCDCLWVSVDQRRLDKNIEAHIRMHRSRDNVEVVCQERDFRPKEPKA